MWIQETTGTADGVTTGGSMKRYRLSGDKGTVTYSVTGDDLDMLRIEAAHRVKQGYTAKIFDMKKGVDVHYTLEVKTSGKSKKGS